ncbi:hypothetical protein F5Y19DRAFT_211491 [Xylariaceae sp. FL1651]|nr:hypothetical protein F5Y19DRAFT_211491 [Xylariaceae sp. FL1651]
MQEIQKGAGGTPSRLVLILKLAPDIACSLNSRISCLTTSSSSSFALFNFLDLSVWPDLGLAGPYPLLICPPANTYNVVYAPWTIDRSEPLRLRRWAILAVIHDLIICSLTPPSFVVAFFFPFLCSFGSVIASVLHAHSPQLSRDLMRGSSTSATTQTRQCYTTARPQNDPTRQGHIRCATYATYPVLSAPIPSSLLKTLTSSTVAKERLGQKGRKKD